MNELQKNITTPPKKTPMLRLQCYFYDGKRKEWKYNGNWLVKHYREKYNMKYNQRQAVLHKIKEIIFKCNRIIVYDNRPEAPFPVWQEYFDGKLVVDNSKIKIKPKTNEK